MDSFVFLGCPSGPSKKPTVMHAVKSEWIELEATTASASPMKAAGDARGTMRGGLEVLRDNLSTSYGPCRIQFDRL